MTVDPCWQRDAVERCIAQDEPERTPDGALSAAAFLDEVWDGLRVLPEGFSQLGVFCEHAHPGGDQSGGGLLPGSEQCGGDPDYIFHRGELAVREAYRRELCQDILAWIAPPLFDVTRKVRM
jgi:hypothetical protein